MCSSAQERHTREVGCRKSQRAESQTGVVCGEVNVCLDTPRLAFGLCTGLCNCLLLGSFTRALAFRHQAEPSPRHLDRGPARENLDRI